MINAKDPRRRRLDKNWTESVNQLLAGKRHTLSVLQTHSRQSSWPLPQSEPWGFASQSSQFADTGRSAAIYDRGHPSYSPDERTSRKSGNARRTAHQRDSPSAAEKPASVSLASTAPLRVSQCVRPANHAAREPDRSPLDSSTAPSSNTSSQGPCRGDCDISNGERSDLSNGVLQGMYVESHNIDYGTTPHIPTYID
jgi:hypothetical protein